MSQPSAHAALIPWQSIMDKTTQCSRNRMICFGLVLTVDLYEDVIDYIHRPLLPFAARTLSFQERVEHLKTLTDVFTIFVTDGRYIEGSLQCYRLMQGEGSITHTCLCSYRYVNV